ncbi:cell division protein ZapA [Lichenibacterium dinghuense]|uniref:cell division protein ZapA n=1 Tax=Lichenibacterium dinghuense TaxID=2895977 RepID=UPI001F1F5F86|nr:cell division protein ZapA [Lichenibacterium sp. 6Y81]
MAQVNVRIGGRVYRMACADGEEEHLAGLAARLDGKIGELRGSFGEIGDTRITVMAALTIADQLGEAERHIAALEGENDRLRAEQAGADARIDALAEAAAGAIGEAAARIDRVAHALDAGTARG